MSIDEIITRFNVYTPEKGKRVCLWCKRPINSSNSLLEYHILQSAFTEIGGYKYTLPVGVVCDKCNKKFGIKSESALTEFMKERLCFLVPNRKEEKIIEDGISKNGFGNLSFDKPEIDRQIIIPFSVQETKNERGGYDGARDLKRAITKALEDTNWRLMSDGVNERLGILTGKLKGYEREEDLIKIIKNDK